MKCQTCGTELEFIKYGEKLGKDGRMAKWPIYAPCPNKANHKSISKYGNLPPEPEKEEEAEPAPKRYQPTLVALPRSSGVLFQFDVEAHFLEEYLWMLNRFEEKNANKPPIEARVDEITMAEHGEEMAAFGIPVIVDPTLSYGYKYVILVSKHYGGR